MAFTKAVLLLVLVCGVFSSAYAADTGAFGSNRKLLFSSAQADSKALCFNRPGHYWNNGKCITATRDTAFAAPFFARSGSGAFSFNGNSLASARGNAVAIGRNARTKTTANTVVAPDFSASQSSAQARSGGGHY